MKIKNNIQILVFLMLCGCSQTTPSMMNNHSVELVNETMIEQVEISAVSDAFLSSISDHYITNGTGAMELTIAYDPHSADFTAMSAQQKLQSIKTLFMSKGISNIEVDTLSVADTKPMLMVSYDSVRAQGPSSCVNMPGLNRDGTTRYIEEYKFGCSTENMIAKQIARPSDLLGKDDMGQRTGRREANIVQGYESGVPREPLQGLGRDNLSTQ